METCEKQFSVTAPSLPAAWQLPEVDSISPSRAKTGNETQFYLTCKLPSCWGRRKEYTQRYLEIGGDQGDLITACNVNPRLNSETGKEQWEYWGNSNKDCRLHYATMVAMKEGWRGQKSMLNYY